MAVAAPPGVSATFWRLLTDVPLARTTVIDVGTGSGRIALGLAPLAERVIGIDRDAEAIGEATQRAQAAGLANVEFVVADAEKTALVDIIPPRLHHRPGLVTAHLYFGETLVDGAGKALPAGGVLAFVAFHVDQWCETGRRSRFAYDEEQVSRLLVAHDFAIEHLEVEREVQRFATVEEALAGAIGLAERWRSDGRWFNYLKFLEEGGRTLTRAHIVARARRR